MSFSSRPRILLTFRSGSALSASSSESVRSSSGRERTCSVVNSRIEKVLLSACEVAIDNGDWVGGAD